MDDACEGIPTNRPVFRGTVPLFNTMFRCPALPHVCPAFYSTQSDRHRVIAITNLYRSG